MGIVPLGRALRLRLTLSEGVVGLWLNRLLRRLLLLCILLMLLTNLTLLGLPCSLIRPLHSIIRLHPLIITLLLTQTPIDMIPIRIRPRTVSFLHILIQAPVRLFLIFAFTAVFFVAAPRLARVLDICRRSELDSSPFAFLAAISVRAIPIAYPKRLARKSCCCTPLLSASLFGGSFFDRCSSC
jgi:hypothetical protein